MHDAQGNALVEKVTVSAPEFDAAIPDPREASLEAVIELAQSCGVSVALVAGRVRYKSGNYRKFARLLGRGKVRRLFAEEGSENKQ
jgi:HTH-type transcriptional regulator / antitoxin HigA